MLLIFKIITCIVLTAYLIRIIVAGFRYFYVYLKAINKKRELVIASLNHIQATIDHMDARINLLIDLSLDKNLARHDVKTAS